MVDRRRPDAPRARYDSGGGAPLCCPQIWPLDPDFGGQPLVCEPGVLFTVKAGDRFKLIVTEWPCAKYYMLYSSKYDPFKPKCCAIL